MTVQRIQQHFVDSADWRFQHAEAMAAPIAAAIEAVLASVTSDGRILLCGHGSLAALAQYAATLLVGGLDRTRPELPALALGTDGVALAASAAHGGYEQTLAAQLRAMASSDDVLLLFDFDGQSAVLQRVAEAARERDMTLVAFTGENGGALARLLRDTDVHVAVPSNQRVRVFETHQLAIHCLCDGLDQQLLGDEDMKP